MLEFAGFSERGNRSGINQDAIGMFAQGNHGLFVVADGMGGHTEGERASREILKACQDWWNQYLKVNKPDFLQSVTQLQEQMALVNRKIFEETSQGAICGAAVALLFMSDREYAVLWAGDCRCYIAQKRIFRAKITQLTRDDTWENQNVPNQNVQSAEIKNHPDYGKLVKAVGAGTEFRCSLYTGYSDKRTVFALCSDGIYKYAGDEILEHCMRAAVTGKAVQQEIDMLRTVVYQHGAPDNLSCILIKA